MPSARSTLRFARYFVELVQSAADEYSLIVEIIAQTEKAVKIRLKISEHFFVQFYNHSQSKTSNYVLIGWNRRLYGRDSVGGVWHRHPYDNPSNHDFSEEGSREITPSEFLEEVFEILSLEGLI
ncbi:MAG: hypothetical protein ACE5KT_07340 [Methanosarcinales archaeon]